MFAGPNGSGKSTLASVIRPEWRGVEVNPDDIEKQLRREGTLYLHQYGVKTSEIELRGFLLASPFLAQAGFSLPLSHLQLKNDWLSLDPATVNSYIASVLADFLRRKLMEHGVSFTFETVMSSRDKVELLETAQRIGYRTYLYYVATDDPEINVLRVRNRVLRGGHDVAEEKIRERYLRSLDELYDAIRYTNRAFVFDNSSAGQEPTFVAEITEGKSIDIKVDELPAWFTKFVLKKIGSSVAPENA